MVFLEYLIIRISSINLAESRVSDDGEQRITWSYPDVFPLLGLNPFLALPGRLPSFSPSLNIKLYFPILPDFHSDMTSDLPLASGGNDKLYFLGFLYGNDSDAL